MNTIEDNTLLEDQQQLVHAATSQFQSLFGTYPRITSCAPGRINIIGEHTDYPEGISMPAAINRWICICFQPRTDRVIQVVSDNYEEQFRFELGTQPAATQNWQLFVQGAVELYSRDQQFSHGFDAYVTGNVPIGSGVSSSAALEMALLNGLKALYKGNMTDIEIVRMGQQIEHQYLGVMCGLMDQYASQFSKAGHVLLLDFRELNHSFASIEMPDYNWVLVNSMVKRELASSEYTKRVQEMEAGRQALQDRGFGHLRDASLSEVNLIDDEIVRKRVRHFISANLRVQEAKQAFEANDLEAIGTLLNASHKSLSEDYEVSCDELDFLAAKAIQTKGCLGSRMMGGGFGGCTINLVSKSEFPEFVDVISRAYIEKYDKQPVISAFQIVDGAHTL